MQCFEIILKSRNWDMFLSSKFSSGSQRNRAHVMRCIQSYRILTAGSVNAFALHQPNIGWISRLIGRRAISPGHFLQHDVLCKFPAIVIRLRGSPYFRTINCNLCKCSSVRGFASLLIVWPQQSPLSTTLISITLIIVSSATTSLHWKDFCYETNFE